MKFGKNLSKVIAMSDPEWMPFWMSYKFMKKKLKEMGAQREASTEQDHTPEAIAKSAGEVAFFKLTRQELRRCSDFFTSAEQQCAVRRARVREGWRQLQSPELSKDGDPHKRLAAACVSLYKDLMLLENYAIMNYCGFSKILKKHDKLTGHCTRERFMKNVCNQAPFALYPNLMNMLSDMEELFREIQRFSSQSLEASPQEARFISEMRSMNDEAVRLQRAENEDMGLTSTDFEDQRQRRHSAGTIGSSDPPAPVGMLSEQARQAAIARATKALPLLQAGGGSALAVAAASQQEPPARSSSPLHEDMERPGKRAKV